jgi:hypothetical protein
MTEELTIPGWVNAAYHGYHANRLRYEEWEAEAALEEEMEERLTTPLEVLDFRGTDPRTPGYVNREYGPPLYQHEIDADTEMMRREDWVDRSMGGSKLAALGPALVSLVVLFGVCSIVFAVVWYGAVWLQYLATFI